jgi:hypothetical protein
LEFLSGCIPNLKAHIKSLVFLFTKSDNLSALQERVEQIEARGDLEELLNHLSAELDVKGEHLLVDPTNLEKRPYILERIKDATPMIAQVDNFRFCLANEAYMLLVRISASFILALFNKLQDGEAEECGRRLTRQLAHVQMEPGKKAVR